MRKVKLLALLLAALMVVAAFAGCANTDEIEADIVDLDERVTALEGKLDKVESAVNEQNGKLDDQAGKLDDQAGKLDNQAGKLDDLQGKLDAIQKDLANDTTAKELEEIEKALEEQKKANADLQNTIKDLISKLDKVEDKTEGDAAAEAAAAALQAAVKVYTTKLNEAKIGYELTREDYTAEDYAFIATTISTAIANISTAKDEAGVKKIYDDAMAAVNGKSTVLSKLVNYYNTLLNNVTADSQALVDEAYAFVALNGPVADVYGLDNKKVTKYETGKIGADGAPVTVNLVDAINNMKAAHVYVSGTSFAKYVDQVKATIKAIGTVTYDATGAYTKVIAAQDAYAKYVDEIAGNGVYAAYLSDTLLAKVDTKALEDAKAVISNLAVAAALYNAKTFEAYKALADKEAYTAKTVYTATDATVKAWATANNLSDANVKAIINAKEGVAKFYETYVEHNTVVAKYVEAYAKFVTIMNRIEALNKMTLLTTENIKEYASIAKAIDAWRDLGKIKDANGKDRKVTIADDTFQAMLVESEMIVAGTDLTAADITSAVAYYGLYDFANAAKLQTATFFGKGGTYLTAVADAKAIDTAVKALNKVETDSIASNNFNSIEQYILIGGEYKKGSDGVWTAYYADGTEKYQGVYTMAAFVERYTVTAKENNGISYSLEFLLEGVPYESGMKAVSDRLATQAVAFKALMINADNKHLVDLIASDKVPGNDYYVNLADKATVEAAQAAYDKWVVGGGNSEMRQWVASGNGYKFTYIFDQTKLAKLDAANDRMLLLVDMANDLVKHFDLMADVTGVKFDNYKSVFASTGKTADNKKYVVLVDAVPTYEGKATYSVELATKTADVATVDASTAVKVADLMAAGEVAYNEFMLANRAWVKASSKFVNETYKPVEDALASIFALELVYVKVVAYDTVVAAIGAEDADLDTYKNAWIIPCENYASLNNVYVEIYKKELKDLASIGYGVDRVLVNKVDASVFDK